MSRAIKLIVENDSDEKTFEVSDNQELIVGRGSNSDTRIHDPTMSRQHFKLEFTGGQVFIVDEGSATGTFLNGARISERVEARGGDEIVAGNTRMQLKVDDGADDDTVVPAKNAVWSKLKKLAGSELGGYRLGRVIGAGKTGLVFEAYNEEKERAAAVKVFSADLAKDDEQRERFVRGMKAFRKIKDPNLIRLHRAGRSGNHCYAVMELIDGENLSSLIKRIGIEGMLDWREVWRCATDVGKALVAAFDHDVTHRNLTPSNIIRRNEDKAYLLGDFTLAKPVNNEGARDLTQMEDILGELHYLPPERLRDASTTDTRSDIYGLGATCYALLTGKPPAQGNGLSAVTNSIANEKPMLPREVHLSVNEHFQSAVMKMLEKSPDDRFQTPSEMLKELYRIGKLTGLTN